MCFAINPNPLIGEYARQLAPHPMRRVDTTRFAEVCAVLNQIVQLT